MADPLATFKLDPKGFEQLARLPEVIAMLERRAIEGAEFARRIAPVDSGDYRDSIEPDVVLVDGIPEGRVEARDWRAAVIEKGGLHDGVMAPAHHTLVRTLDYMAGGSGDAAAVASRTTEPTYRPLLA